jgi:hypothetical protein
MPPMYYLLCSFNAGYLHLRCSLQSFVSYHHYGLVPLHDTSNPVLTAHACLCRSIVRYRGEKNKARHFLSYSTNAQNITNNMYSLTEKGLKPTLILGYACQGPVPSLTRARAHCTRQYSPGSVDCPYRLADSSTRDGKPCNIVLEPLLGQLEHHVSVFEPVFIDRLCF